MRGYRYLHLDVFSARPFEGNPLAVFPAASGLDDATMQAIAREIGFSETTFVLPADDAAADFAAAGVEDQGLFVFSAEAAGDGAIYSRMFAPVFNILEDPATGIASGPLGSYLVHHGLVSPARARTLVSLQGVAMGRPSRISISIAAEGGTVSGVRVGGTAVLIAQGTLFC
jgi:predicted PhzF superfamily epimerase YddE/YHI9